MKGLEPLTPKQLRDAERDKLYIFNTAPRTHRTTICGKTWTIPPCPEGQDISEPLEVPGAFYYTDVKTVHGLDVTYCWKTEDGLSIARDIVGISAFRHESENLTKLGVFISDTPNPSRQAIEEARQKWYDRCSEKIREADDAYALNGGMVTLENGRTSSNIGEDHREAAQILGVADQKPWAKKNPRLLTCDECGTGNLPTAAFCKQCDNMLNEEAAKRKFPAKYAERMGGTRSGSEPDLPGTYSTPEPAKRGPGRPPKVAA